MLYGGNEYGIVIKNNLVIAHYPSTVMLNTDRYPAAFWITNPTNFITGNRAAGGAHDGFAFDYRN